MHRFRQSVYLRPDEARSFYLYCLFTEDLEKKKKRDGKKASYREKFEFVVVVVLSSSVTRSPSSQMRLRLDRFSLHRRSPFLPWEGVVCSKWPSSRMQQQQQPGRQRQFVKRPPVKKLPASAATRWWLFGGGGGGG